jgi:hypothetical protein
MAYWLMSASIAAFAASLSSGGQAKSGKPWARLTASWIAAWRVISRITDSVNEAARAETRARSVIGPLCRVRRGCDGRCVGLDWQEPDGALWIADSSAS